MLVWLPFLGLFSICRTETIELLECEIPDFPQWGGYGPRQDFYVPGDIIHYYCDTDTYIGGNYFRRCEDNGDWSGDTPVCDTPATFSSTSQTSTLGSEDENGAEFAVDGLRSTCTSTQGNLGDVWEGTLDKPGEMIRVMLFLPRGPVSYDVQLLKANNEILSCGMNSRNMDRLEWTFHNCPGPNNRDAIGLRIRSLTNTPLRICEIQVHVLTSPTCVDPHLRIESGRVQLSRKVASLVCDPGYTRSPENRIECVRDGVWQRKTLYCLERQWDTETDDTSSNSGNRGSDIGPRAPTVSPERGNPGDDREREKISHDP